MVVDVGLVIKETVLLASRTAPVKEYFATRMPNVFGQLSEDAGSASVEMVGRETVEHAPMSTNVRH